MDKPWKVIFAFVCVFIAGAVFGGLFTLRASGGRLRIPAQQVTRNVPPRTAPQAKVSSQISNQMMRQFNQRLKLTDDQRAAIRPLVVRASDDLQRLRRENFDDTTSVLEDMHAAISEWLTPEQRLELEQFKQDLRERVNNAQGDTRPRSSQGQPRPPLTDEAQNVLDPAVAPSTQQKAN